MPHTAKRRGRPRGSRDSGSRARGRPAQPALPFPAAGKTGTPPVRRGAESQWPRRHLARLLFGLLTAILIANALIGDRGLPANVRIRREHREIADAIAALRATNERLQHEVVRLRSDPAAIEDLARRDLGLVRPGERVFIVTDRVEPVAFDPERARPRVASNDPPPAGDLLASN